jgi:hypothetical protein
VSEPTPAAWVAWLAPASDLHMSSDISGIAVVQGLREGAQRREFPCHSCHTGKFPCAVAHLSCLHSL